MRPVGQVSYQPISQANIDPSNSSALTARSADQPPVHRTSQSLSLPINSVIASNELKKQIESNNDGKILRFDKENIQASYEEKYNLVRIYVGPTDVVNLNLSDDKSEISSIVGHPPISNEKLEKLIQEKILSPDLRQFKILLIADRQASSPYTPRTNLSNISTDATGATAISHASSSSRSNYGTFLKKEDLFHPDQLSKLELNKDYILLTHCSTEDRIDLIKNNGLQSLKGLAGDSSCSSADKKRFEVSKNKNYSGHDASLIYFRPPGNRGAISKNDIVIAAKLDATKVYDSESRARDGGSIAKYTGSEMGILEYLEMESNTPQGTYLNQYKQFTPYSQHIRNSGYSPEVCVKADKIEPEFFVQQTNQLS